MAIFSETELQAAREADWQATQRRLDELSELSAHLSAATARWLELVWEQHEEGGSNDPVGFFAWRFGITRREVREYLRVAEALQELPELRAAFARGELTFTKVRSLTRVATPASETGLLELAGALTAAQLERSLRAFQRVILDDVRHAHELERVEYYFTEDGSLVLHARLAAEDGTLLVMALDAARERILERRREERARATGPDAEAALSTPTPPTRSARVEALVELATTALARVPRAEEDAARPGARVVVHVDAAALVGDGAREPLSGGVAGAVAGRSELESGPVIAPETARRLGCDTEIVTQIERDGLPLSVGRARRTVPPAIRRALEMRDDGTCCFPGCERGRHLQAHHRRHWAHGGETSLDNLVLLCWHHHRLVHEGGYTIQADETGGGLRFENRFGLVCTTAPPRPPPGSEQELRSANDLRLGAAITPDTNKHGTGRRPLDLASTVSAIKYITAGAPG